MAQQTAVEWLLKFIEPTLTPLQSQFLSKVIPQSKEMEKEQSMNDFMAGKWDWAEHIKGKESKDPAEYYNETYKTQA